MKCPVCGKDCVQEVHELIETLPDIFSPCSSCGGRILDKRKPLSHGNFLMPCACGKRFIDEVFAHIYVIFTEEGVLNGTEPLASVGMPLIHPGFFMRRPPYLPSKSLVLVSRIVTEKAATRIFREVPEVRGVIRSGDFVPGVVDPLLLTSPKVYTLLAGCDVRASVFSTAFGQVVIYLQQSLIHIEFPREKNPKIDSVEKRLNDLMPRIFVDAACGAGTLGLVAAGTGVPYVIMNDAWFAAAYWAAFNLQINRELYLLDEVRLLVEYEAMKACPVRREPLKVAESTGRQCIEIYQGDLFSLAGIIPPTGNVLTALDLFHKEEEETIARIAGRWRELVHGEVFIP